MARTNFSYGKRQREIAKKKKQEDKRQRRMDKRKTKGSDPSQESPQPKAE